MSAFTSNSGSSASSNSVAAAVRAGEEDVRVIEVYEHERYRRSLSKWEPHAETPWVLKADGSPGKCPDEYTLPAGEGWHWESNWRYEVRPGETDRQGWEYAAPKFEKKWSDRARRRLWVRSMRRGSGGRTTSAASPTLPAGASVLLSEAAPKVQSGLRNIHLVRLKIEEIMLNELDASASAQLSQLVGSVRANIDHICKLLDVAEQSGVTPKEAIVVNKLRNDIAKEEGAISKAMSRAGQHINLRQIKGGFTPLQKNSTFAGPTPASSSSASSGPASAAASRPGNPPALTRASSTIDSRGGTDGFKPLSKTASFTSAGRRGMADASSSGASQAAGSAFGGAGSMEAAAAAVTSGGVKKGSAGSFDPSVFSSRGEGGGDQRGVFVPRSDMDERQYAYIEKKLLAEDEATVQSRIIEERAEAIDEIHRDIVRVKELFSDLSALIKEQELEIQDIYRNVDETHAKTEVALGQIVEASQMQKEGCIVS